MYPLTLFAVGGMLLFPAANDLLTMFVALEVLSLPLYLLCGLARRRRLLSQEAAMKYFLLGAYSSAFFLFGIALLYGYAGSVRLSAIAAAASSDTSSTTLLLAGMALVGLGLLFKIGAVPFHNWKPDVYQGAPTPVTALMASCTLVSAFGALLRVFYVAFGQLTWDWRPAMWVVAILTMVVGAIIAITQTDVKRLLAYSSIAHAGFILTGVIAATAAGLSGSLFYLAAYGFTTIGAFAVVTLVRDTAGEAAHLSRWAGLGKRSPLVAACSPSSCSPSPGIPLTSGFTGKFAVFQAAIAGGALPLVIVGVLASAIAAFFYVRIIVLMFFSDPAPDAPSVVRAQPVHLGGGRRSARWPPWSWASCRSRCSTWPATRPGSCSSAERLRGCRAPAAFAAEPGRPAGHSRRSMPVMRGLPAMVRRLPCRRLELAVTIVPRRCRDEGRWQPSVELPDALGAGRRTALRGNPARARPTTSCSPTRRGT